jgi:hypothetical protein
MSQDIDTSNYVYLCMGCHSWGWSDASEAAAIKNCRNQAGQNLWKKHGYKTYRVHPKWEINEIDGTIYTPLGHPAILVTDKSVKREIA